MNVSNTAATLTAAALLLAVSKLCGLGINDLLALLVAIGVVAGVR
jgi:hypothetical protein